MDDLQNPKAILLHYLKKTAELFGSQKSFFLVNGASIGMQAACLALKLYLKESKDPRPVLVARNIHKSTYSGLILAGLEIKWLEPLWHEGLSLYTRVTIQESDLQDYSALIITNPSYEGFYSQIPNLNIPLIVDEAHGAHFHFSNLLPKPALEYGADISVQSWHKTLGSLTQTGVAHINKGSKIKAEYFEACLKLLQTTSPSYLLLESITKVVDRYILQGKEIVASTIEKANQCTLFKVANDDPFRYLIQVPGLSGEELDDYLMAEKIHCEQVLKNSVLAFINPGNSDKDIERMKNALLKLTCDETTKVKLSKPILEHRKFKPRDLFFKELKIGIEAPCPPGIIRDQNAAS